MKITIGFICWLKRLVGSVYIIF